jgi:hypothetical protein
MFAGVGSLCLLTYFCAAYALSVAVRFWAVNTGAGIGSVAVGLVAWALVFAVGQITFSTALSAPICQADRLVFRHLKLGVIFLSSVHT